MSGREAPAAGVLELAFCVRDLYNGQPCPQDEVEGGDGGYRDLRPLNGLPYFVCHHFDSPVT